MPIHIVSEPGKGYLRNWNESFGPLPSEQIHVTMGGQMFARVDKYTGAIVETGWLK